MNVEEIYDRFCRVNEFIMEMDIVSFGFVERVIVDEDGVKIYFRFVEGIWYLF